MTFFSGRVGDLMNFFNQISSYPPSPSLFTTGFSGRFHGLCMCPYNDGALPNVRYTRRDVLWDIKVEKFGGNNWDALEVFAGTS